MWNKILLLVIYVENKAATDYAWRWAVKMQFRITKTMFT